MIRGFLGPLIPVFVLFFVFPRYVNNDEGIFDFG